MTPNSTRLTLLALGLLPALACGGDVADGASGEVEDRTDELYVASRVIEVELTLEPANWRELRGQTRGFIDIFAGEDCRNQPYGSPFTWFPGSAIIDGEVFEFIDVRKKGFIGSLSEERPGLKLDLGEFTPRQNLLGARHLTLNNSIADDAILRQCLGYSVFRKAGVPAPRCSFATVGVNGQDLGLYVNVEPLKGDFLERNFGSRDGNFYEGTLSDFTEESILTFEPKNNAEVVERPELRAVMQAIAADDDQLIAALEGVINLDGFLTFWALEALLIHTDGYSANTNNFYLYLDPASGLLEFVPWGIDGILESQIVVEDLAHSVYSEASLANRLYRHPEGRRRYFERLQHLLDTVWDEPRIIGEIDEMEEALLAVVSDEQTRTGLAREIDDVRDVVLTRREAIGRELERGEPEPGSVDSAITCAVEQGSVTANFDVAWGSLEEEAWFDAATAEFTAVWQGEPVVFQRVGAAAGVGDDGRSFVTFGVVEEGQLLVLSLNLRRTEVGPGEFALDWLSVNANLGWFEQEAGQFFGLGFVSGDLELDAGGTQVGDRLAGSLTGTVYNWPEE